MISDRVQQGAVAVIEATIPVHMTLDEWRRSRSRASRRRRITRRTPTPVAARHLSLIQGGPDEPAPLAA
jgi:hypothetical protein